MFKKLNLSQPEEPDKNDKNKAVAQLSFWY